MNQNITLIEKPSINDVKGFFSNALCAEIKKKEKLDLGVVFSEIPCTTIGMFTTNKFQAAPVVISKEHLKHNIAQAVVVNSGNANACTGENGLKDAKTMCEETASILGVKTEEVLVASTGVIGQVLPIEKIVMGIKGLKDKIRETNDNNFSKAIMTTDTIMKISGVKVKFGNKYYSIVGTCKGSGMIHPNMATMLAFIYTDLNISKNLLNQSFKKSILKSFNSVTIDGDTSTNDTALIFANGLSGIRINSDNDNFKIFCEALDYITISLVKLIAYDGEGATKRIEIELINAKSELDAKKIAMSVAKSSLVKTAFFGEDANWGRIVCAMGYSNVDFDINKVDVYFGDLKVCENGKYYKFSEDQAKIILSNRDINLKIDMKSGSKNWTVWTSDLSYDYVKINGSYRT
jgi:glutamate N-acetyltransferase / amino-acid N-acetyltransferase